MKEISILQSILNPTKLFSRTDILTKPNPVPRVPGIYWWYFKDIPHLVPKAGCHTFQDLSLLYLGISPSRSTSKYNLAKRIQIHYGGDASRSTLRMSLGCLLCDDLGIQLQVVRNRLHFGPGEDRLSQWMSENAFVTWVEVEAPWNIEENLIKQLDLPLNLKGNKAHPFYPTLTRIRKEFRQKALKK